jgi:glycosyltransferase involved in cell wall biosynthesis
VLNGKRDTRISVVVPLYNHERYIAQALGSVFAQTTKPAEVIVVDDGACDASAAIVRDLAVGRPELIFWSHPNQGAHYTINAGIHRATGDFVAILNSDDAYHPERLTECLAMFDVNADVAAVCTGLNFIDEHDRPVRNRWYEDARRFYEQIGDLSLALINANFFMTTSNLIIRRSVFHEIGFFSGLRYAHDLDFFLRLSLAGKRVHFHDKPLLSYRLHPTNTIQEDARKVKVEWAAVTAFFIYNYWHQAPISLDDWRYFAKFTEITNRHGLTPLLVHFFAFFDSLPRGELSCEAFARDENFYRFLLEVVR